jgi:two-component system chemotaxis sensor kinase CheA
VSPDPLRYFRVEARELVDQISAGVLDLDQDPGPDLVARLLRFAHTLKGAARVVRQQHIADRAHAFEEVLVPHRAGIGPLPADEIRALLRLNDEIEAHVVALEPGAEPGQAGAAAESPAGPLPAATQVPGGGSLPAGAAHQPGEVHRPGTGPGPSRTVPPGAGGDSGGQAAAPPGSQRAGTDDPGPHGAGPHGAGPHGAGPHRAGPHGAGPHRAGPHGAGPHRAGPHGAGPQPGDSPQRAGQGVADGSHDAGEDLGPQRPPGAGHAGQPGPAPGPDPALGPAGPAGTRDPGAAAPAAGGPQPGDEGDSRPAGRSPTSDVDELLDAVGEAHARFAPLRTGTQALEQLRRGAEALADRLRAPGARPIGRGDTGGPASDVQAAAVRLAADLSSLGRRLTDTVDQAERELDEVRGRAERLRLVAASGIFTALHRAVRDAAEAQGKRVVFAGHGGDLRIDPQVLAQAASALLHVVRNAVAHGIETADERLAAGKPPDGRVVVEVQRRRRYAAFRCCDDGRGFDLDAVRRTAEERGLLPPGRAVDQQTLLDLVLRGGISTSTTVTDVAGRGIGLDVARDVAQQLGGQISVTTTAGAGTTVELVVPLSLLSLQGLVVQYTGAVATLPLDSVQTCVRLSPAEAAAATATGRMAYDGHAVPFLPLARALAGGATEAGTAGHGGTTGAAVAVIVAADGESVAIGVDRLAGTCTLVVRPLPELAPAAPAVGGVSLDLDGNPRLVLDAQGLVAAAARDEGSGGPVVVRRPARRPILVVDDSLTTRMLERSILESAGYEVDVAASGEEGLELARQRDYCLYLTDIDMPGIDGFTFVERTRADPQLSGAPAILVSSRATAEDRDRGAAVGAGAYVVKGEFDQEELLAHIRRLVPA